MTVFVVRLPDVGEGVAEAELVEWLVSVGDRVTTESALAEVLTDKATVEISSPVEGVIAFLNGEPGDRIAVGTEIIGIETGGSMGGSASGTPTAAVVVKAAAPSEADVAPSPPPAEPRPTTSADGSAARPIAAPTVRQRARDLDIDLREVHGSGPSGRIVHADLDAFTAAPARRQQRSDAPRALPVRGLRRRIAERLTQAWTEIPHITYVDEVDATQLEALRTELNDRRGDRPRLTLLPFVLRAIVLACRDQPNLNATYDAAQSTLHVVDAVHAGIATQTEDGLVVPVVRHVEARGLWDLAAEITRLATAAREGRATRDELTGSTITVSSLGALGGLVTTPIINQPEVAIIGVNKLEVRPVWRDGATVPRTMFNLSSSFDHRIVDGWDAATFVQRLKSALEMPALLFMDDER